jgi:hypothetical protein
MIYIVQVGQNGPVKIGRTKNPMSRIKDLQVMHFEQLRIIRLFWGESLEEHHLHSLFLPYRIRGEWYNYHPIMMGDVGLVPIKDVSDWDSWIALRDKVGFSNVYLGCGRTLLNSRIPKIKYKPGAVEKIIVAMPE